MLQAKVKKIVQKIYGNTAKNVLAGDSCGCVVSRASKKLFGCCSPSSFSNNNPISRNLYQDCEKSTLPENAVKASLGCGNPTALLAIQPGQTVLDLGSGGGIDVLLSAQRVGPTGKVYGIDMTDEMLALARENQKKAGVSNVEFIKGDIENIPLPAQSVDVVISNCVINLSSDKDKVLQEAYRVLKPGGWFAVSDIVVNGEVPAWLKKSVALWTGCVAGALQQQEYKDKLNKAGFHSIEIEPTRVYTVEDAQSMVSRRMFAKLQKAAQDINGKYMSAFIRARK